MVRHSQIGFAVAVEVPYRHGIGTIPHGKVSSTIKAGARVSTKDVVSPRCQVDFDGFVGVIYCIGYGDHVEGSGGGSGGDGEGVGGYCGDIYASSEGIVGENGGGTACSVEVDD